MPIKLSCSWCHEMNLSTEQYCKKCGHEVGKSRMACACPQCYPKRKVLKEVITPKDAAKMLNIDPEEN